MFMHFVMHGVRFRSAVWI